MSLYYAMLNSRHSKTVEIVSIKSSAVSSFDFVAIVAYDDLKKPPIIKAQQAILDRISFCVLPESPGERGAQFIS